VDITYTIVLRRKPMFFTYNLVFPCVLLMGIGILVFFLPPESGEKVSLSVTVLLAMTVYQLLIAETIPATSEVIPLIGKLQPTPEMCGRASASILRTLPKKQFFTATFLLSSNNNATKFHLHLKFFAHATLLKASPGFHYILHITNVATLRARSIRTFLTDTLRNSNATHRTYATQQKPQT